jgi:hypothetical protein
LSDIGSDYDSEVEVKEEKEKNKEDSPLSDLGSDYDSEVEEKEKVKEDSPLSDIGSEYDSEVEEEEKVKEARLELENIEEVEPVPMTIREQEDDQVEPNIIPLTFEEGKIEKA